MPAQAGMNRWQWDLQGDAPPLTPEQQAQLAQFAAVAARARGVPTGVPFVAAVAAAAAVARRGRAVGALVGPGTYLVRVTLGGQTVTTAVTVVEDVWMVK